ncbi:MAG TPA: TIM barrel protein [Terriglobia bacterium]|nr:TIM barrel protein [Terriglobia bacterium]
MSLKVAAAIAAIIAVIPAGVPTRAAQKRANCTPIPVEKIALQLYSVRNVLQPPAPGGRGSGAATPETIDAVFGQLHSIGFRNAELYSGTLGLTIPAYKALLAKNGLHALGAHGSLTTDIAAWQTTIGNVVELGQGPFIGSAGFTASGQSLNTYAGALEIAANLNKLGEAAAAKGLRLYLHNHAPEFNTWYDAPGAGGKTTKMRFIDVIIQNTDPRYVHLQIDVHWARVGIGVDKFDELLSFLEARRDRIDLLHVKDTDSMGRYTDLGRGTTDWVKLFAAAGPQIRYYIWELDDQAHPMQSAQIAYDYLTCRPGV